MNKKLENQVIIVQNYNGNVAYEFTKMKSDMNKRDYEFINMRSDISNFNTMIKKMISQKQHSSPQRPRVFPLRSWIKISFYHWKVNILQKWWHMDSQT